MEDVSPNLLISLFGLYPRDRVVPRENFLSEAFAYVLKTVEGAADAWVTEILGVETQSDHWRVLTRGAEFHADQQRSVYPDLRIDGISTDGRKISLLCEHKWHSPFNGHQVLTYSGLSDGEPRQLAFVCRSPKQLLGAVGLQIPCFLWEDVYRCMSSLGAREKRAGQSRALLEFLEFMEANDLSPGPAISKDRMKAFVESDGFKEQLKRYANKLRVDYPIESILEVCQDYDIGDRWGRVAIEYSLKAWEIKSPLVTLGFLYSGRDHQVKLLEPNTSVDLMLRIEANPTRNKNCQGVLTVLKEQRQMLQATGAVAQLLGEPGNGNPYTLLIVRRSLASIIEGIDGEREQLGAIHAILQAWCDLLFTQSQIVDILATITP